MFKIVSLLIIMVRDTDNTLLVRQQQIHNDLKWIISYDDILIYKMCCLHDHTLQSCLNKSRLISSSYWILLLKHPTTIACGSIVYAFQKNKYAFQKNKSIYSGGYWKHVSQMRNKIRENSHWLRLHFRLYCRWQEQNIFAIDNVCNYIKLISVFLSWATGILPQMRWLYALRCLIKLSCGEFKSVQKVKWISGK